MPSRSRPTATTTASFSGWRSLIFAAVRAESPRRTVSRATAIASSRPMSRAPGSGQSVRWTDGSVPSRLS